MGNISVDYDVLNQKGSPAWYSDLFANIPTPGYKGRMFISIDTFAFYRDNGVGWDLIGGPGTGTITGAGVFGQVTFFSGTDTISGNTDFVWDNTNKRLGINTGTPGAPLDIHCTGTAAQFNGTTTNNAFVLFQNAGTSKWRIGNLYNAGANDYQIFDVTNSIARLTIKNTGASTLIGTFTATSLIKSGGTSSQILLADGTTTPTSTFGAGSVTNVSALTLGTSGTDLTSTVANSTTTPTITLNVPTASATNRGALSSTDWTIFNNKQATLSLTTTGTSGAATLVGATLNIPNYTNVGTVTSVAALTLGTSGTDLSSTVANSTSTPVITLNVPTASATNRGALSSADFTTFNNKQSTISVTAPVVLTGATISMPAATTSVNGYLTSTDWNTFNNKSNTNGTVTSVVALTIGTTGIDITSTAVTTTTTPVITLNIPTASASNRGALSSTDWTIFNNKQATLSLTTTGTSGAATLVANTLNVPNYGSALSGYLPLSGGTLTGPLGGTSATFSSNIQVGGAAIPGNSSSFYNTSSEASVAIKQTSGATNLALGLWNNDTTADSRFLRFFTEATATYRGSIQYDRPGNRLAIFGGGSGLLFDGAATFSSSVTASTLTTSNTNIFNNASGRAMDCNSDGVLFAKNGGLHNIIFGDGNVRYYSLFTPSGAATMSIRNFSTSLDMLTFTSLGAATFIADATINSLTIGKGTNSLTNNTAFGVNALLSVTTGNFNIAVGESALRLNTTGQFNVAIGSEALINNTIGTDNTAVGNALNSNTSGSNNTAIGSGALAINTTGSFNTAIGGAAMNQPATGSNKTAVGYQALGYATGSNNIGIGYQSGFGITTGTNNHIFGQNVQLSTGSFNTMLGYMSSSAITTGSYNTIIGNANALGDVSNNIVLADGQGNIKYHWDGTKNNFYGNTEITTSTTVTLRLKGNSTTGFDLQNDSGGGYIWNRDGTAIYFATNNTQRLMISSGGELYWSLSGTTGADLNPGGVLFRNNSGRYIQVSTGLTTDASLLLFYKSDGAGGVTNTGSISTSGNLTLYNTTSDYRLKEDFKDFNAIEKILGIKVYDFAWKFDKSRSYGVMAHELEEILPYSVFGQKDAIQEDGELQLQQVDYSKIVPILVKAIQELNEKLIRNNIN